MAEPAHKTKFIELRDAISSQNYSKALALSTALLKLLPHDEDVLKSHVLANLHLGKFADALQSCRNNGSGAGGNTLLTFERAYTLYELGKLPEALTACKAGSSSPSQNPTNHSLKALEAQVLYRLQRSSEAADVYLGLLESVGSLKVEDPALSQGSELLVNMLAAYAAANRGKDGLKVSMAHGVEELVEDDDDDDEKKSHEIAYNAACVQLSAGKHEAAVALLEVAAKRCRAHQEEVAAASPSGAAPLGDEECAILSQLAYARLLTSAPGSRGAAQAMLHCMQVLKAQGGGDHGAWVAAANNLAVVRRDREPADSLHRLRTARAASNATTTSKVTPKQTFSSKFNEGLLLLQLGSEAHLRECRVLAEELIKDYPRSAKPSLLLLALNLRDHRYGASGGSVSSGITGGSSGESPAAAGAASVSAESAPKWRQVVDRAEALGVELSQSAASTKACDYDDVSMAPAEAHLFAVQVLLQKHMFQEAAQKLATCPCGVASSPGGAATIADLEDRFGSGDHKSDADSLEDASNNGNRQQSSSAAAQNSTALLGAASRAYDRGKHATAAALYQEALDIDDGSLSGEARVSVLAKLVLAWSWLDPSKAEELAQGLPFPSGSGRDDDDGDASESNAIDAEDLERTTVLPRSNRLRRLLLDRNASRAEIKATTTPVALGSSSAAADSAAAAAAADSSAKKPPASKHPKRQAAYVAALAAQGKLDPLRPSQPDPERWVPKKLRASNLRKLKRAAAKGVGGGKISGAQGVGADGKEAAKLDAFARAQQKKAETEAAEAKAKAAAESGKRGPYRRLM